MLFISNGMQSPQLRTAGRKEMQEDGGAQAGTMKEEMGSLWHHPWDG